MDALNSSGDYQVVHITDELMGLNDEAYPQGGTRGLSSIDAAYHRHQFRQHLSKGLPNIGAHLFGRNNCGGNHPSSLFIWKVPLVNGPEHERNVLKAIDDCRELMPKKIRAAARKQLNNILAGVTNLDSKARKAITNLLYMGECNVTGDLAQKYCSFVLDLANGEAVDDSFMIDGREFNSRGGRGTGVSHYNINLIRTCLADNLLFLRPLNMTNSGRSAGALFTHRVQPRRDDMTTLDSRLRSCQFPTSFGVPSITSN